jgi:membrane-bound serine protease (ClpP class)
MVGEEGHSRTKVNEHGGTIFVHGEYWTAVSDRPVDKDHRVKVVAIQGSVLKVEEV